MSSIFRKRLGSVSFSSDRPTSDDKLKDHRMEEVNGREWKPSTGELIDVNGG